MGYAPKHRLVIVVTKLPKKIKAALILSMAGCATLGAFAFAGVSSASIHNGNVVTSNGEAGWFTWSGSRFDEVHADVVTTAAAEQNNGGKQTLGNGVGLCANTGSGGDAAQIGEVWNPTENKFDVVWAVGTLNDVAPNTNGNPCTDGGALTPGPGQVLLSVPVGETVYLQIRQWNTHIQFIAQDLTTGLGYNADNVTPPWGTTAYPHFAQAGTTFDQNNRSAPAATTEADFCWVRASTTTTGEGETQGNYFSHWAAQTVVSTPSGTNADPALVAPTDMNPHMPGGLGCFTMNVGAPTGT